MAARTSSGLIGDFGEEIDDVTKSYETNFAEESVAKKLAAETVRRKDDAIFTRGYFAGLLVGFFLGQMALVLALVALFGRRQ